MNLLVLAQLWILFCVLHSVLITPTVETYFKGVMKEYFKFYRLGYTFVNMLFLVLIFSFSFSIDKKLLFHWQEYAYVQYALLSLGLFFFIAGAKEYDLLHFVGLRQIFQTKKAAHKELHTSGILQWVRHPFYTGTFMLLWARNGYDITIVTNLILSAYLIVGTYIEERKLIDVFGEQYLDYTKKVSMFVPIKKLLSLI